MRTMRRTFAGWLVLMMVCLLIPFGASAEISGWRLLDSQQNGDSLEVWFATDEQVSAGRVIYNYGGINLEEQNLSTMEGVGYIFVVDNTSYYSNATEKDPRNIVRGAVSRMSNWDSVCFIGVTQDHLGMEPSFGFKDSWETAYNAVLGAPEAAKPRGTEYTWDAISKAVSFARESYQKKTAREIVLVLITDGAARGKSKDSDSCKSEIESLPFTLPFYCVHVSTTRDEAKFVDFTKGLSTGVLLTVSPQNAASIGADCVIPYSNLIYKSTLRMGPEIHAATSEQLTVSLAGSQKGFTQDGVSLNKALIPTPTPEPTEVPTPTPTPEVNPQYVGDGVGAEHDIWELQRVLIQLGFMSDAEPSGMWDPATASALNLYYKMNGIGSDQIPVKGGMTKAAYDALMQAAETGLVNTPTPAPTETPTPEPTPTPTIDPQKGQYIGYDTEDRSLIRTLNKALKEKYYLDEDAEGSTYGDATEAAVDAFYKDHPELSRPSAGEGISRSAYEALLTAKPKETPVPTPEPTEDPYPAYINFETSNVNLIAELNQHLIDKFFVSDANRIDLYVYNEATDEAIREFYKYYSDEVDSGVISKPSTGLGITRDAFEFLLGSEPIPTATPIPDLRFVYDDDGMQSADALKTEKRLQELGYLQTELANSDADIRKAILWFAERNGMPAPEDYMDDETFQKLMSEDARPAEDPPEDIAPGAKEPAEQIKEFQDALKKNGYFRDVKDSMRPGVFDEATQAAYKRFAQVNDIAWDGGIVTWDSQQAAMTSTVENPPLDLFENTKNFVTGNYEIFGLKVPVWALIAAGVLIIAAAVVVVIMLVKGKKQESAGEGGYEATPIPSSIQTGADAPTAALEESSGISTGADAPTADPEGCVMTLMITGPSGMSQDTTYNLADGDQLVIGRGSDADIVTETEDTMVSRSHGVFRYNARRLYYEDRSRHHTIVDGEILDNTTVELKQGSQLQIGRTTIKVQWS